MTCPNCNSSALGGYAVRMKMRGTGTPVDGAICSNCGTVFVPEQSQDELDERLRSQIKRKKDIEEAQQRLDEIQP